MTGHLWRVVALLIVVAVLSQGSPQSFPTNPLDPPPVSAATGWYNRTVSWWMDDSDNTATGGDVYRVRMSLSWQTQDFHAPCYMITNAAPDGTRQPAYHDGYGACHVQSGSHYWYPSRYLSINCWISNAFLISVQVNYCGKLNDPQNYAPYWFVYGSRFQTCVGLQGTPFNVCAWFRSKITVLGSSFWVWNSAAS